MPETLTAPTPPLEAGDKSAGRGAGYSYSISRRETGLNPPPTKRPLLTTHVAALIAAAGALIISSAYALGREEHFTIAQILFWLGQIATFVPIAWCLTATSTTQRERLWLVTLLAAIQAAAKWFYSPLGFRYGDELLHWRTASDILATHHLFHANAMLPISPVYPGLEVATSAVAQTTHVSLFAAGALVAAIAHICIGIGVFLILSRVTHSGRAAGIGTAVFLTTPNFGFLESAFIYETLGLAFAVGVFYLALKRTTSRRWSDGAIALILLAAVITTHHLTAIVTIVGLLLVGLAALLIESRPTLLGVSILDRPTWKALAAKNLGLAVIGGVLLLIWILTVAPSTLSYLFDPVGSQLAPLVGLSAASPAASAGIQPPFIEVVVSYAATATLAGLIAFGAIFAARQAHATRLEIMALLGLSYLVILGVRVLDPAGTEITGRALVFAALFSSAAAGLTLMAARDWSLDRMQTRLRPLGSGRRRFASSVIVVSLLTILMIGGVLNGWPPSWERIPGKFHVASWESGYDGQTDLATKWAAAHVQADSRIACDIVLCTSLGGFAHLNPVNSQGIIQSRVLPGQARHSIVEQGVDELAIDQRMSKQAPGDGRYFAGAPRNVTSALPRQSLRKFNGAPGIERVYDSGSIRIYALGGARDSR